jgi:hypothetical protein
MRGHWRRSIRSRRIRQDLLEGALGGEVASLYHALGEKERTTIADGLQNLFPNGPSFYLHGLVCRELFPHFISYRRTGSEKGLLLYLATAKTPVSYAAATLCQWFFLPIDLPVYYYWTKHFGVIGFDATMRQDELVLF